MREGYVPVYIRMGDTPLNEINPELAIAFHEIGANGRQLKSNDEVSGTKTFFSFQISNFFHLETEFISWLFSIHSFTIHHRKK